MAGALKRGQSHDLKNWQAEAAEACLRRQYARLINGMMAKLSRHLGKDGQWMQRQVQRRLKTGRELEKKARESSDSYSAKDSYSAREWHMCLQEPYNPSEENDVQKRRARR